jgi:hypothetical protein
LIGILILTHRRGRPPKIVQRFQTPSAIHFAVLGQKALLRPFDGSLLAASEIGDV